MENKTKQRYCSNAADTLDNEACIVLLQNALLCWFLLCIEQILIGSKYCWINTVKICTDLITRAWLSFLIVCAIIVFNSI